MSKLEPRKLLNMPVEEVLKFYPSMELDIYVFDKVLQGPYDIVEETRGLAMVPSFSRKFGDCYPLLIMAIMSSPKLEISADEGAFVEAVRKGQMVRKNEIRTWRVKDGDTVGYGRTFPEAICKFMICKTFNIKGTNVKIP
jgi:hypothetical protein